MKKKMKNKEKKVHPLLSVEKRTTSATVTIAIGGIVNLALFMIKIYVGLAANTIAVLGDAVNNLGDALVCLIAAIGFLFVRKKASDSVPYGYGRMEYIADFLMSVIVCLAGATLAYLSIERLFLPYLMTFTWLYFSIIAGTVLVKVFLGWFYYQRNKKVGSGVLRGAMLDSFADIGVTVTTLIGFLLFQYAGLRIDGVFGLIVSVVVIVNGAKLIVSSVKTLLGRPLPSDHAETIGEILSARAEITEVRSMHLHEYGASYKELVIEVVLTEDITCDIITNMAAELRDEIKSFGYEAKICIVR